MASSLVSQFFPFFLLLGLILTTTPVSTAAGSRFREKKTQLHFYYHEIDAGPGVTFATVASQHKNSTFFGDINVLDSFLTEGPEPSSTLIGRAQGMAVNTSLNGATGLTVLNLVFTAGKYNGSTLAMLGMVSLPGPSDRSIVGGSGKFRMARGYVVSNLVSTTATTLAAEFNATLFHY